MSLRSLNVRVAFSFNAVFGLIISALITLTISSSHLGIYVNGPFLCHSSPACLLVFPSLKSLVAISRMAVFYWTIRRPSILPSSFSPKKDTSKSQHYQDREGRDLGTHLQFCTRFLLVVSPPRRIHWF